MLVFIYLLFCTGEPKITDLPQSGVYTVNETNNVTMVCRADGVPQPTISWTNASSGKNVGSGEQFHIVNTRSSDDGAYTCTATNELGSVSEGLTLHVQSKLFVCSLYIHQYCEYRIRNHGSVVVSMLNFSSEAQCFQAWSWVL